MTSTDLRKDAVDTSRIPLLSKMFQNIKFCPTDTSKLITKKKIHFRFIDINGPCVQTIIYAIFKECNTYIYVGLYGRIILK